MSFLPVARVINLDRSTDRLAACGARLTAAGIAWQRHAATAPASLEAAHSHPLYRGATMRRLFGRDMTRGEIGCYLSHMAAMQASLDEGAPLALIFEDDAVPFEGAKGALEVISHWMLHQTGKPVDWLHLSRPTRKLSRPLATVAGLSIRRAYRPPLMSNANLYTRKGIQDFMAHIGRHGMDSPLDDALLTCFNRSAHAAVLDTPIFGEDASESTIDPSNARDQNRNKFIRIKRKVPECAWAFLNMLRGA